jgi:hypothetical protein
MKNDQMKTKLFGDQIKQIVKEQKKKAQVICVWVCNALIIFSPYHLGNLNISNA